MNWKEDLSVAGSVVWDLPESEWTRWLGYPSGRRLEGQVADRVDRARSWYAQHGRPFATIRSFGIETVQGHEIRLENGSSLTSPSLAHGCTESNAHHLICAALSAGPEIDAEVEELWALERPDEAYVLDRVGVAVTESLRDVLRSRIDQRAFAMGFSALPAIGPGHDGWPLEGQGELFSLIGMRGSPALAGAMQILASGMLSPKLSMLLACPLSMDSPCRMDVGFPCSVCNYVNCSYRKGSSAGRSGLPSGSSREEIQ